MLTPIAMFVGLRTTGEDTSFFAFAYYSHSIQHEAEFQNCKLGSCISLKL